MVVQSGPLLSCMKHLVLCVLASLHLRNETQNFDIYLSRTKKVFQIGLTPILLFSRCGL